MSSRIESIYRAIRILTLFIVSLFSMLQTSSAQIDRTRQPAPDPAPTATFPPYEEFTLSNGMKVFYVHEQRPLITLRMIVRGGQGVDGELPGLSDAVADLMTHGTTTRSALQFAQEIDFVGGNVAAAASSDLVSVSASGLKKNMPTILELFADAIKNPAYSTEELEKYRQDQITGLKSAKARAEFLAQYASQKLLYGNTGYGRMPTEEGFRSLTPEKIRAYHVTYFVPRNATLAFVGDMTREELTLKLESAFGDWKGTGAPTIKAPKFPDRKQRRVILVDRPTAVQSTIRVLGRGPMLRDPERPKSFVLNSILGGGTGLGNRLAMNLRETHAWTYTPSSGFDANMYLGSFVAAADVRNEVTDSAITEILSELERLKREPVPADEMERNVQSAVGTFLMSVADPSTTAVRVQSIDFYGLPKNYFEKLVAAYLSTTTSDLQRLARNYFDPDGLAIIVVGKASEVKPKLEKFGKVEVWNANLEPVGDGTKPTGASADQVWGKMLTAMGGEKKLRAVKSIKTSGTMTAAIPGGQFDGTYLRVEMRPNKQYTLVEAAVFKQEISINGKEVWQNPMGQPLLAEVTGVERDKQLETAYMLQEAYLKEIGATAILRGTETIDGKKVHVVDVTFPKNGIITYYIDTETFLPTAQESESTGLVSMSGWQSTGGIKLPTEVVFTRGEGFKIAMKNLSYELNGKVDEALFNKRK